MDHLCSSGSVGPTTSRAHGANRSHTTTPALLNAFSAACGKAAPGSAMFPGVWSGVRRRRRRTRCGPSSAPNGRLRRRGAPSQAWRGPGCGREDRRRRPRASAEAALTKVLSLRPDDPRAHMFLGTAQVFTNRGAEGIAELERALALDPSLAENGG